MDSLGGGVMVVDPLGSIRYLNLAGRRILEELAPGLDTDRLAAYFGAPAAASILSTARGPFGAGSELQISTPQGEELLFGFTTTRRIDNGEETDDLVVAFREITGLSPLRGSQGGADRYGAMAEIASVVAHEVRNPLAGIRTMAQSIHEHFAADDSRREYSQRIIRQVDRLNTILKDFLSMARLPKPNRAECSLFAIVQEVKPLVEREMRDRGVAIFESYEPGLPQLVADANQMHQILLNLLINAVEALEFGGEINLTARLPKSYDLLIYGKRDPRLAERRDLLMVEIRDDGPGMRKEILDRVFDPFFTTKTSGTGLGLAIVQRIVQAHGGAIFIDSNEGAGTACTLFLPIDRCVLPDATKA
jgi:signal transduction histidine kinase